MISAFEVHELYSRGLSISEIARRLKISRASVNYKLREYDLERCKKELKEEKAKFEGEKANLEARKAKVEERERKINRIPHLEERAQFLESKICFLSSKIDSLTTKRDKLVEEIRVKNGVLDEIRDGERRKDEMTNQLSELTKTIENKNLELSKAEVELEGIKKEINIGSLRLYQLTYAVDEKKKDIVRLAGEKKNLEEGIKRKDGEFKVKSEAINEIKESYYGFLELTKQIALYMPVESSTKTKTHEEIRKKVLRGMEIIAEKTRITKPEFESDLQALLRDPTLLKNFALGNYSMKLPRERYSNHDDELK